MTSRKPNYYEQLKHPRWQAKRLKVLERENFTCQWCGDAEQTLHVHHTYYEKGAAPWEYRENSLLCLCETCHKVVGDWQSELTRGVANLADSEVSLLFVAGYISAVQAGREFSDEPRAGLIEIQNEIMAQGVGDYFWLSGAQVLALCDREDDGLYTVGFSTLDQASPQRRQSIVSQTFPGRE